MQRNAHFTEEQGVADQGGVHTETHTETQEETRYPPGAQILVRDEEWLVKNAKRVGVHDGDRIEAIGVSEFVRDEEAVFFTGIDKVDLLEPENTRLVPDTSSYFRRSRLFLEAVLRKTPLPQSERGLALADRFLLDPLAYQQRPAELALSMRNLRPRILIADVVGLGKTLEIGLILAELIRRGRGERILVVTPQSILEQFQRELWTRFAIPLVRLDSLGIQRIQREIPAGRNPFTHYKRVIISVDTLKNIGQYRHHLERIQWDAVVIDESHNLINPGSQRRALAEILGPRTDALLLASATPHNGDKQSFADLISLLDPAAIADPNHYDPEKDLGHLFIRRTKISPEVRDQMGDEWADRGPTVSLRCTATAAEEKIWMAVTGLPSTPVVGPLSAALDAARVGPALPVTGGPRDPDRLKSLVPAAVSAARDHLERTKDAWDELISEPLAEYRKQLAEWRQESLLPGLSSRRQRQIEDTADEQAHLLDQLQTTGRPLLRVLAVLDKPATPEHTPEHPGDHSGDHRGELT